MLAGLAVAVLACGCSGGRKSATKDVSRVEDMSSGRIQMSVTLDPPKVEMDKDTLLTIRMTAPGDIDVSMPALDDRVAGFTLSGVLDEEPSVKDGKTILERRARLTPNVADEYRIAPMAITYTDRSKNPAESGWFATRPIVLDRVTPVKGKPGSDIEASLKPVWIYPSFRTVALWTLLLAALAALAYAAWRVIKRIHREIKLMRMSPRERALFELSELLGKDLIGQNLVKDFYLELTMIVRRYIERQHAIRAPEQTTEEFLIAVSRDPRFSREVVAKLRSFLQAADLVKFAADHPTGEATTKATFTAKEYIETDAPMEAGQKKR